MVQKSRFPIILSLSKFFNFFTTGAATNHCGGIGFQCCSHGRSHSHLGSKVVLVVVVVVLLRFVTSFGVDVVTVPSPHGYGICNSARYPPSAWTRPFPTYHRSYSSDTPETKFLAYRTCSVRHCGRRYHIFAAIPETNGTWYRPSEWLWIRQSKQIWTVRNAKLHNPPKETESRLE